MTSRRILTAVKDKTQRENENGAKWDLLQEIFNDTYRHRQNIYKVNFVRGIFFGFGSVLGGTIVFAIVFAVVTFIVNQIPGSTGHTIQHAIESVQKH